MIDHKFEYGDLVLIRGRMLGKVVSTHWAYDFDLDNSVEYVECDVNGVLLAIESELVEKLPPVLKELYFD